MEEIDDSKELWLIKLPKNFQLSKLQDIIPSSSAASLKVSPEYTLHKDKSSDHEQLHCLLPDDSGKYSASNNKITKSYTLTYTPTIPTDAILKTKGKEILDIPFELPKAPTSMKSQAFPFGCAVENPEILSKLFSRYEGLKKEIKVVAKGKGTKRKINSPVVEEKKKTRKKSKKA